MTKMIFGNTKQMNALLLITIIVQARNWLQGTINIIQHYDSEIAYLSMRTLRDERGNTYYGIDEDIRRTRTFTPYTGSSFIQSFKIVASSVPFRCLLT